MKKILINATAAEELRVAVVEGKRLLDLEIERASHKKQKSNIYLGKIVNIEQSLEAAFVDYGQPKHGFLPFKDIAPALLEGGDKNSTSTLVKDLLKEGQEFIVQISREERGNKGAALTTMISIPGRYLVLMPNNPGSGGISRQLSVEDRDKARIALQNLNAPAGIGVILRTAGHNQSLEELRWDLDYLMQLWESIKEAAKNSSEPKLIYREGDIVMRTIRDYFQKDVAEIWIDEPEVRDRLADFMRQVIPTEISKLKFHTSEQPIFVTHQIEQQIQSIFSNDVILPSGGSIRIDHTEALIAIDINSAKSTKGGDIEETALHTNQEAVDEIARQMKLRDLGGLLVIDFIDMFSTQNRQSIENRLIAAVSTDRARVQIGQISKFGLLELSRQRLRGSFEHASHEICVRCNGSGKVGTELSVSITNIRKIEEVARANQGAKILIHLPVSSATLLLNEKRDRLIEIEKEHQVNLLVIPSANLSFPECTIKVMDTKSNNAYHNRASHEMMTATEREATAELQRQLYNNHNNITESDNTAIVSNHSLRSPHHRPIQDGSGLWKLLSGIWNKLFTTSPKTVEQPKSESSNHGTRSRGENVNRGRERSQYNGSRRGRGRGRGNRSYRPRGERKNNVRTDNASAPAPTSSSSSPAAPSSSRPPSAPSSRS